MATPTSGFYPSKGVSPSSPKVAGTWIDDGNHSYDVSVSFSEIIFSKDFKKAVLIFGESFGKRNGASHFLFLKKEDGNWEVQKSITYEIS